MLEPCPSSVPSSPPHSRVARLPEGSLVLPAICTEERITLGAELEDGTVLRGQNQISHPPPDKGIGEQGSDGGGVTGSRGGGAVRNLRRPRPGYAGVTRAHVSPAGALRCCPL